MKKLAALLVILSVGMFATVGCGDAKKTETKKDDKKVEKKEDDKKEEKKEEEKKEEEKTE